MIRKNFIIGTLCTSLIFANVLPLNSCFANTNETFQYNLKPKNPLADDKIGPLNNTVIVQPQKQELLTKIRQKKTRQVSCQSKYGIELYKDYGYYWGDKLFITDVIPNSPAQRAGLKIGDRIIKINNQKVRRMSVEDANYVMDMNPNMTLLIKDANNKKRSVNLTRSKVCIEIKPSENEIFLTYWNQLYDGEYDLELVHDKIQKLNRVDLSYRSKSEVRQMEEYVTYWLKKKKIFKNSYKSCDLSSYDDTSLCNCLSKFVDKELAKIAKEEEYAMERYKIRAKLQMFAMSTAAAIYMGGAIKDHAHALRNQNVHHSHSGSINLHHLRY